MNAFTSLSDTLVRGAPIVRLYRTALGRDPGSVELREGADLMRRGASLVSLAGMLLGSADGIARHGPDAPVDEAFATRVADAATGGLALGRLIAGASLGASRASLVAALAESEAAQRHVELLPGLAPGTSPDDGTAYALWRRLHEGDRAGTDGHGDPQASWPIEAPGEGDADPEDREDGFGGGHAFYSTPDRRDPDPVGDVDAAATGQEFALFCAAGDTEIEAALRTLASLREQRDPPRWRLHLAAHPRSPWTRTALADAAEEEDRLVCLTPADRSALAASLAAAAAAAPDTAFAILSPGDVLAPDALAALARHLASEPGHRVVFADDDLGTGRARRQPRFRPAWSLDSAAHAEPGLAVMRGSAVAAIAPSGILPEGRPDAADADATPTPLALRVARAVGEPGCGHLPRILLHRQAAPRLPASAPAIGAPVPVALPDGPAPSVAVLVPTRNRASLLAACAAGVLERTDYPDLTLVVIDNGSDEPEALALLERLAADPRVRVVALPGPFNFASLNNRAAEAVDADILVLLNNDTEVLHPGWLAAMVALAVQPDVGAVGARLLYPDGTLQHAGILVGPGARATHVGRHARLDDPGYLGRFTHVNALSAVTGACLAIRRDVYRAVSGMDERLAVTWNDIDLCLRVRARGLRVLWTPFATLTHHEAKSRGFEADDAAARARARDEAALVHATWGDAIDRDPFLNPNLFAMESGALSLATPRGAASRPQLPRPPGFAMSPQPFVAARHGSA